MLDSDLATLYGVETRVLNQAVSRNQERFPEDFMFRLSTKEWNQSQSVIGSQKHRNPRYPPRAFSQEGIAMLSSVLRSKQAVQINIAIMRTFVRLRHVMSANEELAHKIAKHDKEIALLFRHVKALLQPKAPQSTKIGFQTEERKGGE